VVKNEFKLNPVLVGAGLGLKPIYITLLLGNNFKDIIYLKDLFINSLKPHKYINNIIKIMFDNGITLNIVNILFSPKIVPANIKKLLFNGGTLYLIYSF